MPDSKTLAEIFEILFDNEEVTGLVGRLPGTVPELASRTGLPEAKVESMVKQLLWQGSIRRTPGLPDHFQLEPNIVLFRDHTVLWPEAPQRLFDLWEHLFYKESFYLEPLAEISNAAKAVRVLPIEQTVELQQTALDIDSAVKVFEDADLIAVQPCPCRVQARKTNRSPDCPAPEVDLCMKTNSIAQGFLSRGIAQEISRAEAVRRVGLAEDAGLVHLVLDSGQKDTFMCNCCSCCCAGLYLINHLGYPDVYAPSRFRVKMDEDACTGCGVCEERCHFDLIRVDDMANIDYERCYGCGNCVTACPEEALTLEEVRPKESIRAEHPGGF
jgi:ferredoxin